MYKLVKFTVDGGHFHTETVVIPLITFTNNLELEKFISCCKSYVVCENTEYKRICSPTRISLKLIPVEPIDFITGIRRLCDDIGNKVSHYNKQVTHHNMVLTKSNKKRHKPLDEGHIAQYSLKNVNKDITWISSESENGIISIA